MIDNSLLAEIGKVYTREFVPVGTERHSNGVTYIFLKVAASSTYIRNKDLVYYDADTKTASVVSQLNVMGNAVSVANINTADAAARYAWFAKSGDGVEISFYFNACTNPVNATTEVKLASYGPTPSNLVATYGVARRIDESIQVSPQSGMTYSSALAYITNSGAGGLAAANLQNLLAVGDVVVENVQSRTMVVAGVINGNAATVFAGAFPGAAASGGAVNTMVNILSADGACKGKNITLNKTVKYTNLGEYGTDSNINLIYCPSGSTLQSPNAIFGTQVKAYDRLSCLVNGAAQVMYLTTLINAYAASQNGAPLFGAVNVHNFNVLAKVAVARLD